jgi:hypothetical protein
MNGYSYNIVLLEATSDINVFVGIQNDVYDCIIVLVANQTIINGIVQTSAQMIIDTLTNGQS